MDKLFEKMTVIILDETVVIGGVELIVAKFITAITEHGMLTSYFAIFFNKIFASQ
jgi:hypothetical protein